MNYTKLYRGDCLEIMQLLPDKSIDMILCDLPYGATNHPDDIRIPFEPLWKEYERVIKDNGAIVLFGQGTFYIDLVNSNRRLFRYDLVWDKQLTSGFLNANRMHIQRRYRSGFAPDYLVQQRLPYAKSATEKVSSCRKYNNTRTKNCQASV